MASIGEMTQSSTNKLRAISRKVTLVRLLDDTSTGNADGAIDDKENGSHITIAAAKKGLFSERSSNDTNNGTTKAGSGGGGGGGGTIARTNHAAVEALRDLRDLNSIVSEVERRAAALRDAIDSHRRDNNARREMSETARRQTAQLAATLTALPAHLPHAAPTPARPAAAAAVPATAVPATAVSGGAGATATAVDSGPATRFRGNTAAPAAPAAGPGRVANSDLREVPVMDLVTVGELQGVPRSTRARLTIEQVNGAVAEIQKAVERRCVCRC